MAVLSSDDAVVQVLAEAPEKGRDELAVARFGKCKMCSCSRYTTSSNDWQFCDCGHSRSQHQS